MKQVSYLGFTNITNHRTKFSHHGDLSPGICASLYSKFLFSTIFYILN